MAAIRTQDLQPLPESGKIDLLAHLTASGSLQKAADSAGLSVSLIRRHMSGDPEFFAAVDAAARASRVSILEDEAMRRAVEGVEEPVYQSGVLVGVKRVYSDKLLQMMLAAADPARYGDRKRLELVADPAALALLDDSTRAARISQLLAAAAQRAGELAPAQRLPDVEVVAHVIPEPSPEPIAAPGQREPVRGREAMAAILAKRLRGEK